MTLEDVKTINEITPISGLDGMSGHLVQGIFHGCIPLLAFASLLWLLILVICLLTRKGHSRIHHSTINNGHCRFYVDTAQVDRNNGTLIFGNV